MNRLLNFGCGSVFHREWVNLDAMPAADGVIAHDVRRPFPYPDGSFDGVYGSHVLEHLEPSAGARLLRDCRRILRPGGIIRVVVPDLEAIVRLYMSYLEGALTGDTQAEQRYDWMMLELYDQAVRTWSGGQMAQCLQNTRDEAHAKFVESRIGRQAGPQASGHRRSIFRHAVAAVRRRGAGLCASVFLGAEGRAALQEGLFRRSGEVHQWMYDRFSLQRALNRAGFAGARVCAADESAIPGFDGYGLETIDGRARKPDSLYVEASKPGSS